MQIIYYDESGDLSPHCFYQLEILPDFGYEEALAEAEASGGITFARVGKPPDLVFWCEVLFDSVASECCNRNESHILKYERKNFCADTYGGSPHEALIFGRTLLPVVVDSNFAKALREQPFVGYELEPLKIAVNQSRAKRLDLYLLHFRGRDCLRPRIAKVPTPNKCPFCGRAEVVCPQCLEVSIHCPACKRRLFELESARTAKSPEPFTIQEPPKTGRILNGNQWDGSDFIDAGGQGIISRRVLDWLFAEKATSFIARGCRMDVTGMSHEMRDKLRCD